MSFVLLTVLPPRWRIGTIAFGYKEWSPSFYPKGLQSSDYLAYYAKCFDTVEIDSTFHGMPTDERVQKWEAAVPEDFRFSVKTLRDITHAENVGNQTELFSTFLDHIRHFGPKLGNVLLQFPSEFNANRWRELEKLLQTVPSDIPLSVEFRHNSWWDSPNTQTFLKDLNATWAVSDLRPALVAELNPAIKPIRPTTARTYTRLIGVHDTYPDINHELVDPTARLKTWLKNIQSTDNHEHWILLGNDYAGYAIATAERLKHLLSLPVERPRCCHPYSLRIILTLAHSLLYISRHLLEINYD